MNFSRITRIKVNKFKNLTNFEIDFQNITVLVGANNAGKSNFLRIFKFLKNTFQQGSEGKRAINRNHEHGVDITIEYLMMNGSIEYNCKYRINTVQDSSKKSLQPNIIVTSGLENIIESFEWKQRGKPGPNTQLFYRSNDLINYKQSEKKISKSLTSLEYILGTTPDLNDDEIGPSLLIGMQVLSSISIFNILNVQRTTEAINGLLPQLSMFRENSPEKYEKFKDAFCRVMGFEDIHIHKFEIPSNLLPKEVQTSSVVYMLYVQDKSTHILINSLSDGTKIMFLLLFNVLIREERIVVIDELEIGLHPMAINKFLNLFLRKEIDRQLLFTTHSPFILNSIDHKFVYVGEKDLSTGESKFLKADSYVNLEERLKSRYVDFGDLFASNFANLNEDLSL